MAEDWIVGKGGMRSSGPNPVTGYNWRTSTGWQANPLDDQPQPGTSRLGQNELGFVSTANGVAVYYLTTQAASGLQAASIRTVITLLEPETGEVKSTCDTPYVAASAVGANGNMYILASPDDQSDRKSWLQIDPKTCASLWPDGYQAKSEAVDSSLLVGPSVAASMELTSVLALDVKTGALRWTTPVLFSGRTILANTDKAVTVELAAGEGVAFLNPATGEPLNSVTPEKGAEAIADRASGVTYIGSGANLTAYDPTGASTLWTQDNVDKSLHFTRACADRLWLHRGSGWEPGQEANVVLDGRTGATIADDVDAPLLCLDGKTGWYESGAKPLPPLK